MKKARRAQGSNLEPTYPGADVVEPPLGLLGEAGSTVLVLTFSKPAITLNYSIHLLYYYTTNSIAVETIGTLRSRHWTSPNPNLKKAAFSPPFILYLNSSINDKTYLSAH